VSQLPLFFQFRNLIAGDGFIAFVATRGRVLLSEEDGKIWMYGVQPGGLAAFGSDRQSAFESFRVEYHRVLEDAAQGAASFTAFRGLVQELFQQIHEPAQADWETARQRVLSYGPSNQGLPVIRAENFPSAIEVLSVQSDDFDPRKLQPSAAAASGSLPLDVHYGKAA